MEKSWQMGVTYHCHCDWSHHDCLWNHLDRPFHHFFRANDLLKTYQDYWNVSLPNSRSRSPTVFSVQLFSNSVNIYGGVCDKRINRKWVELQVFGTHLFTLIHVKKGKRTRQNSYEMCGRVLPMRASISRDFPCSESQLDLSCSQHHITSSELYFIPLSHISSIKNSFAHVVQEILSVNLSCWHTTLYIYREHGERRIVYSFTSVEELDEWCLYPFCNAEVRQSRRQET